MMPHDDDDEDEDGADDGRYPTAPKVPKFADPKKSS